MRPSTINNYFACTSCRARLAPASIAVCLIFLAAGITPQAMAQETDDGMIEEITVTATKRGAQSLQDVPFAMQAISGDELNGRGAVDFDDFFRLVPGLAVFDQGPGDKRYIIRGVNSVGAGTVGLYLDEAIITGENAQDGGGRQPDIKVFDVERIEVLKGPQGTTFGSSSLSGTIRYITNKPSPDQIEGRLEAGLRSMKDADMGYQLDGALNIPLVQDKAAIRGAIFYLDQDGYIDNVLASGVNNDETIAGRLSFLYQPSDSLSLSLMAMYQNLETDGPAYFNNIDYSNNPLPGLFQADVTHNGFEDELQVYNATLEFVQDYGTITATASYLDRDTTFDRDASLALEAFIGLPHLGAGRSVITQPKNRELQSYEIRYASDFEGPVQILVGGFYQTEERFFRSAILSANSNGNIEPSPTITLDRNVTTEIDEVALFAEVSFEISDRLTFTGGARYFDIEVDEVAESVVGFGGGAGGGVGPGLVFAEDDVIFKGNLSYYFTDDVHSYVQVAEGFRSGGTNDQTAAAIAGVTIPEGFGSDSLINYELGVKSQTDDRRWSADAALYYIDWSNIQLQDQATDGQLTFPFRGNGGAADIIGIELELSFRPVDGLDLGLAANFNQAELSEDNPIPTSGQNGDDIPYVPNTTISATANYEWPLATRNLTAFVGGDIFYVDSRNTELRPDNSNFVELDSYTLLNLRAGIENDSGWSASLVINNLADDDTVVDVFRIIPGLTPDGFIFNTPRTIVLSVAKDF